MITLTERYYSYVATNAKHCYDVETVDRDGARRTFDIHASNRDQAARIAERAGLVVMSVNMTG